MIIGSASGKRILAKIWNVDAPYDRASAILAGSVRLKPVAELIITIGPAASATAMIRGQRPKPIFSRRKGTNASIGVVTMIRTYGAMIFSRNGFWVNSAASSRPTVEPIARPARNSIPVTLSEWISVLEKSWTNVVTMLVGFGKT